MKILLWIFLSVTSITINAQGPDIFYPNLSDEDNQNLVKRDSALRAYMTGDWDKVIKIFEEMENKQFIDNKLLIAASNSYKKLFDQNSIIKSDYLNKSEELWKQGINSYGEKVMAEGIKCNVYTIVQQGPKPIGEWKKYLKILSSNLKYPSDALKKGVEGRVFVQFIVNKDGTIGGLNVLKGLHPDCDLEAIRVLKEGPEWIPGKQDNQAVYVKMVLPVTFDLKNYKKGIRKSGR